MPLARAAVSLCSHPGRARWLVVLSASVLLHILVFNWAGGKLVFPAKGEDEPRLVIAVLQPPPPPPPKPVPKPRPKPVAKKVRTAPAPPPVAKPAALPAPVEAEQPVPAATAPAVAEPAPPPADDGPALADVMPELEHAAPKPRLLWQAVDLPPSAELHFEVHALKDGQKWYGNGVFRWSADDMRYRLLGEANASLLFFKLNVLNFTSEGVINEFGIAPLRYAEQPRGKPAREALFLHDEQSIRFPASNSSHPYQGGEQDRASVIWQLAGIGRAAPERFRMDAELEVTVAGPRDADIWHIRVIGLEEVEVAGDPVPAWHLARVKQRQEGDQRIEFWLAPDKEWYPVMIRQSGADDDHLTLTLDEIKPLTPAQPN